MTAIKELMAGNSAISNSRMWDKDVEKITPEEVSAYLKVMAMRGLGQEGLDSVEMLLSKIRPMLESGAIKNDKIAQYNLPTRKFNVSSLHDELSDFSIARRTAIIVCIMSDLTLSQVATLKRKDVRELNISTKALEVIMHFPASINTDYVFWEYSGKRVKHIFDLERQYKLISNRDVEYYRSNMKGEENEMSVEDYWLFRRAFWKSFINEF